MANACYTRPCGLWIGSVFACLASVNAQTPDTVAAARINAAPDTSLVSAVIDTSGELTMATLEAYGLVYAGGLRDKGSIAFDTGELVTFSAFAAAGRGCDIQIEWSVGDHPSAREYVVERSTEAGDWVAVDSLTAIDTQRVYSVSEMAHAWSAYYRLSLRFPDGRREAFPQVAVGANCVPESAGIYLSETFVPADQAGLLQSTLAEGTRVLLIDGAGHPVTELVAGGEGLVSMPALPADTYVIRDRQGNLARFTTH